MDKIETVRLLRQAHDEVIALRRRLAEVEPKAHAYETLAIFAEDVAWRLKEAVEDLLAEIAKEAVSDKS